MNVPNAHDLWLRLRAIFSRRTVERELTDELDFHLAMQSERHMARGVAEADAWALARREFGSVELSKEDARDARRVRFIDELAQDVRYALRGFRRAPTFAATVILTIGLALGLNTTVFSIFNAYVLRPLEIRSPATLFDVAWFDRSGANHQFSQAMYDGLARDGRAFDDLIAQRFLFARVDGQPSMGELVSGNYFDMLGVPAALGRTLHPGDAAAPGMSPVMVLSHRAWVSRFGQDSSVIGRRVLVHGLSVEIVGVAREGFGGLEDVPRDFWVPLTMIGALSDTPNLYGPGQPELLLVSGRLKAGVSPEQAKDLVRVWAQGFTDPVPERSRAMGAYVTEHSTAVAFTPEAVAVASPIIVAFALVLLIATANVANMMLARGMARQREIGIRLSLGAGRARLIRQLVTEAVLLAIPAAFVGFVLARVTLDAGVRLMFATLPGSFASYMRVAPLQPDFRAFVFILVVALASTVLFGLAPALQATRPSVVQAARGNFDHELHPSRLRDALVLAQVTAASVLLIVSGVLYRNAHRIERIDPRVRTANILQVAVFEKGRAALLRQLRTEPGIVAIGAAGRSPLDGSFNGVPVTARTTGIGATAFFNWVSGEYFTILDIPLVAGRGFTAEEGASGAPVTIVSQATARRLWSGRDPVGESLVIDSVPSQQRATDRRLPHAAIVIGVARDAASGVLVFGTQRMVAYFPSSPEVAGSRLILRTAGDAMATKRVLTDRLDRLIPGAVEDIHTMEEFVAGSVYPFHAAYWVSSAIAVIAVILTLTGIYGVLSCIVIQRTREIGIRIALGATTGGVVGLVVTRAFRFALIGSAAGIVLALAGSRLIASFLQFMDMFDIVAYGAGTATVLGACIAGSLVPARRAAGVDPIAMLRQD